MDHRTAGESRIVYALAEGTPYALARPARPRRPGAEPRRPRHPGIHTGTDWTPSPSADVTALEVVDSLVFSPDPDGRFTAAAKPVTRDGVTELWRARMEPDPETPECARSCTPSGPGPATRPAVRPAAAAGRPRGDRRRHRDRGEPLQVERLWLTSQGSFLDLTGAWARKRRGPAYLHRSTAGRDLHVEVTERGYLAPFGHSAPRSPR